MKDSVIYQEIFEEGFEMGMEKAMAMGLLAAARSMLLRVGSRTLGKPAAPIRLRIEAISNLAALETLTDRVLDGPSTTWNDLLEISTPG